MLTMVGTNLQTLDSCMKTKMTVNFLYNRFALAMGRARGGGGGGITASL